MASLDEAFKINIIVDKRVQVPSNYKPVYGYICAICNGCVNYHNSIQGDPKKRHAFVKGKYRELLPYERGPFNNGEAFLN